MSELHFMTSPNGHTQLMADLTALLDDAKAFQFDDFKNTTYATPKVELYKRLLALAENVKKGTYDQA